MPDQNPIFAFLQDPGTHGRTEAVTRIDTHGAAVFLVGPDVYKVKKAVRFPFMDFSTLEKRRAACEAEIAVNRDNAPELYLGVVPITKDGATFQLGGAGETVEWAVHLRRFDENATLDRLAAAGALDLILVDALAKAVIDAHRKAPRREGSAATAALRGVVAETAQALIAAADISGPARTLGAALMTAFNRVEPLLLERGRVGQVRRCHGDLHLGNLALIDGAPVLFDAIEFDEAIATTDILYDLAFLVMDLCERGLGTAANRLLNRYLAGSENQVLQIEGLAAFPLFLSLRAAIRAKVLAAQSQLDPSRTDLATPARAYFEAAVRFLEPVRPVLVAVGGLSGTGKTTLAAAMAPEIGRAPGALHLRSDVERKRMMGAAETERLPPAAYGPEISYAVYTQLEVLAAAGLHAGQAAIVDATHLSADERSSVAALADRQGVRFVGIWLEAPSPLLVRRVTGRRRDASDADANVVAEQADRDLGAISWPRLDAAQDIESLKAAALALTYP
jgi:aminoglycoside phosphotransferase family enzyme/predicted kinase